MLKGGYSLCIMLVINPIVIVLYQNCSMSPVAQARLDRPQPVVERQIASEAKPKPILSGKPACDGEREKGKSENCPKAE